MRSFRLPLIFLLATSALANVQEATYSLIWQPKKEQAFNYAISIDTVQQSSKIGFGAQMAIKVVEVGANGDYTVEVSYQKATVTIDGQKQDGIGDEPQKPDRQKFNAMGDRIDDVSPDSETDDPLARILSDVMDFNAPPKHVKISDKWTKEIPGDEKHKTRPVKLEYLAAGTEEVGSLKAVRVTYSYAQTEGDKPVKAEGFFLIDAVDGSLIVEEAAIENFKFEDGTPTTTAKVRVERK